MLCLEKRMKPALSNILSKVYLIANVGLFAGFHFCGCCVHCNVVFSLLCVSLHNIICQRKCDPQLVSHFQNIHISSLSSVLSSIFSPILFHNTADVFPHNRSVGPLEHQSWGVYLPIWLHSRIWLHPHPQCGQRQDRLPHSDYNQARKGKQDQHIKSPASIPSGLCCS